MSFTNVQSKTTIDAKFSATGKSLISKVGRVAHLEVREVCRIPGNLS
jgi:hypothetical protein